jgi:hypothetical protein
VKNFSTPAELDILPKVSETIEDFCRSNGGQNFV